MAFPKADRVIYRHNPLEQVICQLKFPTVLRIESELPARFQDRIRSTYPLFSEPQPLPGGGEFPEEVVKLVGSLMPIRPARVYEFSTLDGQWKLTLSRDFLALVCLRYERWEDFVEHLRSPGEMLASEYAPAFLSRVGLRYRNVIRRSVLGLDDVPWAELLKPQIAGELATSVAPYIRSAMAQVVVDLEGSQGKVTIHHGLANIDAEECYLIDNDFFTEERIAPQDADKKLDFFHSQSGRLFQWCVQKRLHDAMQPNLLQ